MTERKNGFDLVKKSDVSASNKFCEEYKRFINFAKTEREAVVYVRRLLDEYGFVRLRRGMRLSPGDRVYRINRNKALIAAVIGEKNPGNGCNIAAAHIDAPRVDLKPNPLYEESSFAYFKTHYYGGIKKYQWLAVPLEIRGVVLLKDGSPVEISIGADPFDPVFCITDLLPHLSTEQMKKNLSEAVTGEGLNILGGSRPMPDDEGANRVKLFILDILNEKYGITEADFQSAELSAVPAGNARDVGIDRSMIGAYGQDDRVCAFAAFEPLLRLGPVEKTAVCVLADKEEIGSEGVTGMKSAFFETFMEDICASYEVPLRACFEKSVCLSADVTAAFDPNYPEVYEKNNSAYLNYGPAVCKYTGSRGKAGASDAPAELVSMIRRVFDGAGIFWQICELGKVDAGGGGTVAAYMANRNIDTIDVGVPLLSMHSPFEIASKLDIYMTGKAIEAFYRS